MAQYKTGKVSITHGSTAVVGYSTTWDDDGITPGWIFTVKGESNIYWIDSVDSNTEITLSQNYYNPNGVDLYNASYSIVQDYTTNYEWPKIANTDYNWVNVIRHALLNIDKDMGSGERSTITFDSPSQGTTSSYYMLPGGVLTQYYLPNSAIPAEEGVLYYDTYNHYMIYLSSGMTSGGTTDDTDYLPVWVRNWRKFTTKGAIVLQDISLLNE